MSCVYAAVLGELNKFGGAQVILGLFSVFPPSAWFSVSNPLPFVGVYAAVLLASAWAAHTHGALCAELVALLPAARRGKLQTGAAVSVHASSVSTEIDKAP